MTLCWAVGHEMTDNPTFGTVYRCVHCHRLIAVEAAGPSLWDRLVALVERMLP